LWNLSEINYDWFFWGVSIDGTNYYGWRTSGNSSGWVAKTLNLTSVPTLGNVCGKSQVWICFVFTSDGSGTNKGSFIDDIELRTYLIDERIMVNTPNGGERWLVGSTQNITWNSNSTSGNVKIDYSINNGTSWSVITASTTDDGSYAWTVPNTPSTTCLVRITDTDGNPTDQSNTVFTIYIEQITISAPNGGERWLIGSTQNITWSSTGTSGNVKLDYSTNTGASWTTISASTADDGTYAWTVPNTPSTNCQVRITDTDGSPADLSNNVFTIYDEVLTLTAPNGRERWAINSVQNITWISTGTSGNVKLDYSINNGSTWTSIRSSTPDDGSFAWTIPSTPSTNCLVRISDTDGSPIDQSNAVFTIFPEVIVVTTPNGGESWETGSSQNITWTSSGTSGHVKIEYSTNSGANWSMVNSSVPDNGAYIWTVPNTPATTCLVKISDTDGTPSDQSNQVFSIISLLNWKVPVTITSGTINFTRTFGGDVNATQGYDQNLDVLAAPPGLAYYVYLQISDFPYYLDTDLRPWVTPFTTELNWNLKIANAAGKTSTMQWNAALLPTNGSFTLLGAGVPVNMRQQNTITLTESKDLTIRYSVIDTITYTFTQQGWYLISLPVTPADATLTTLFPSALAAFEYNSVSYNYTPVTALEVKKAYWILIPAATTAKIAGYPFLSYTAHYRTGWHLIGSVKGSTNFADPADNPNNAVIAAYGYNPDTGLYFSVYPTGARMLEEKQGYWIAVGSECDLTIGVSGFLEKAGGFADFDPLEFYRQYGAEPPKPPFVDQNQALDLVNIQEEMVDNFPNPFNLQTTIQYALKAPGRVQIYIYNAIGQRIRVLVEEQKSMGVHQVYWDAQNDVGEVVPSGIYFFRIMTPNYAQTRKMILMK
ncbi:T9SS type A sorting domain-containing protein, partial [candidate division KSB1 bacterium]|nr:T9SS type A sorting domain-containing protein [candidate division KSB1 bacterium]